MIRVSNIERFATHDGPGIRTTIFLQGCPLHCPWCANPETWTMQAQLMHDSKKCISCQRCMNVCKERAISFPFHWDMKRCTYCHACEDACLESALHFSSHDMEIEEVVEEVLKDEAYYENSHGGVTISGGEPCMQLKPLIELLKALKKRGLHTALETTGNYSVENLKQILPYVDLFLYDIKHVDKEKLKNFTGADLDLILNNLQQVPKEKVIIRMPVIPDFNGDVCQEVIQMAKKYNIQEVNLLPFHTLGANKWNQIEKEYMYKNYKMLDRKELEAYISYGKKIGVTVKIGG